MCYNQVSFAIWVKKLSSINPNKMHINNHNASMVFFEDSINYASIFNPDNAVVKEIVVTNNSISQVLSFKQFDIGLCTYKAENKNNYSTAETTIIKACKQQQRMLLNVSQLSNKPTDTITTLLFQKDSDSNTALLASFSVGNFANNHWLNTPGPIYTTKTNNNINAGKLLATSNIAGDDINTQIIFKQPFTQKEVDAILLAATLNDGEGYYADGNQYWNKTNIINWWAKSEERVHYIIEGYKTELFALISNNYAPDTIVQRPVPENYKLWLDFYRYEMKQYLQWYIYQLENIAVALPELRFDWSLTEKLNDILNAKLNQV